MNYLILFLVCLICLILFILFYKNKSIYVDSFSFSNSNSEYIIPSIEIKISDKIGSRGAFASKDYNQGDIIEICPCISDESSKFEGILKDYVFQYDETYALVALGTCSIYNHSDNYNALWTILSKDKMQFYATKDIKKGEEIFTSYGSPYWNSRNGLKK